MSWREDRNLENVAIDFNTVRRGGLTNMLDTRRVIEICRDYGLYHLPEFVEEYGVQALWDYVREIDFENIEVDEEVLDEM